MYIREVPLHIADGPKASDEVRFVRLGLDVSRAGRLLFLFFVNVYLLRDSEFELRAINVLGSLCQAFFLLNEQTGAGQVFVFSIFSYWVQTRFQLRFRIFFFWYNSVF